MNLKNVACVILTSRERSVALCWCHIPELLVITTSYTVYFCLPSKSTIFTPPISVVDPEVNEVDVVWHTRFINTLASSIPQNASFFITYIMVDGWSGPAGELLRLKPLVKYHLKNALFCRTERDRLEAASPGTLALDQTLPQLLLYFLMGLVYSVITPVILPFIIIFLAFAFVVYRNQVSRSSHPTSHSPVQASTASSFLLLILTRWVHAGDQCV